MSRASRTERRQESPASPVVGLAAFLLLTACPPAWGAGEEPRQEPGETQYHTLLAGEEGEVTFLGRTVRIPAVDRSRITALTLGGSLLVPRQGDAPGLPVGALLVRRFGTGFRTRDLIALFMNQLEYARRGERLELVSGLDTNTLPWGQTELADNREMKETSIRWGTALGSAGPGLWFPVHPFQVDNDFRLQLLGRVGYLYAGGTHSTGNREQVPPDTLLYGAKTRIRYDGMRRNLLELPHEGVVFGADLDYLKRDRWLSLKADGSGAAHRDYWQATGYVAAASGVPGLSERNRLLATLYLGWTQRDRGDRFNAFSVNGGPLSGESDDLTRVHYSGGIYRDVRATSYATASVAYRRELLFFLYLSAMGSYIRAERATVRGADQVVFRDRDSYAATVSLDSAFLGNSSVYLAYSWDSGVIREGRSGSGVVLLWNKLF